MVIFLKTERDSEAIASKHPSEYIYTYQRGWVETIIDGKYAKSARRYVVKIAQ